MADHEALAAAAEQFAVQAEPPGMPVADGFSFVRPLLGDSRRDYDRRPRLQDLRVREVMDGQQRELSAKEWFFALADLSGVETDDAEVEALHNMVAHKYLVRIVMGADRG